VSGSMCEDNITVSCKNIFGSAYWIRLAQARIRFRIIFNTFTQFWVP
jgi:hypothetical protein